MVVKILSAILFCAIVLDPVLAQYGSCDYEGRLLVVGQKIRVQHAASSGTCRYKVFAPADTFIKAICNITFQDNTCQKQQFIVSRSGEKDLRDGLSYCGSRTLNVDSIGNELVVVISTSIPNSGFFECDFYGVAPDNNNCDCGWNVHNKIVGGTQTGVNEFVSHAGLVDAPTKEVYCGAIISNLQISMISE